MSDVALAAVACAGFLLVMTLPILVTWIRRPRPPAARVPTQHRRDPGRPMLLPPGTAVSLVIGCRLRHGIVKPAEEPDAACGVFPVLLDDGTPWKTSRHEVVVVSPAAPGVQPR